MMSRRRNKPSTPDPQPPALPAAHTAESPQAVDNAALLERLAALETLMAGEDGSPAARRRRELAAEEARTTRPPGAAPEKATHCPYCGTPDSATGWRLLGSIPGGWVQTEGGRTGWACRACADVAQPPFINGSRTIPNPYELSSLLISAHFDLPPIRWLALFGGRYNLIWEYANRPGTAPWSHIPDLERWERVATLAARRHEVGMGALPAVDWEAWFTSPTTVIEPRYNFELGAVAPTPVSRHKTGPDPNTPERLAEEEQLVETLLKAKRRREKEDEAAAAEARARKERAAEVRAHYLEHRKVLDEQYREGRDKLRAEYQAVLEREGLEQ